jgi:hypothetical protein
MVGAFASRCDGILTRNEGDFRRVFPRQGDRSSLTIRANRLPASANVVTT